MWNIRFWNRESWALESGIRDPSSTYKDSGIQYLESGIQSVESWGRTDQWPTFVRAIKTSVNFGAAISSLVFTKSLSNLASLLILMRSF